jgi:hypothetical protein
MPSGTQDRNFASEMKGEVTVTITESALDIAISWIGSNLDPDDVFSTKDLENWAESNGYVKE